MNLARWLPRRATVGDGNVRGTAYAKQTDINTPIGPQVDLRVDGGGLLGAGITILPVPPSEQVYSIAVRWDLKRAPKGTKVASSWGEGQLITFQGKMTGLQTGLFAAGLLHKWQPLKPSGSQTTADATAESLDFSLYHFGEPSSIPFNISSLRYYTSILYGQLLKYFDSPIPLFHEVRDYSVDEEHYSAFLRSSPRTFGGVGFHDSLLLEPFPKQYVSKSEINALVAHELIHNLALMECPTNAKNRTDCEWYNEGVAIYYTALCLSTFDFIDRAAFLRLLNQLFQAYYTNPAIGLTLKEAEEEAWHDLDAQRVPYHRGAVYLFALDLRLRRLTGGWGGLHDLVYELRKRRRQGRIHDISVWLELLREFSPLEITEYKTMANGIPIFLPETALETEDCRIVRQDQEQVQLGFSFESLNSRKITGTVPGSRAEAAGVRNGDEIVLMRTMYWQVAEDITKNMTLEVRRPGEGEIHISYWPRTWEKVESWQIIDFRD